ncbi:MAG TPA: helix-turn-helix transcriptional regulator [Solirubrobacterales bacterium]|nr:helix-turn-helix transcriptional regulator [Solirubrobacterales bacterium]
MSEVIPALREVLREAREDAGLNFAQVAAFTDKGETVFRRLENGTASPRISEIGEYVSAYEQAVKAKPLELWTRAIDRAAGPTTFIASPGRRTKRAVAATQELASERGRRKQRSKGSRRASG